MFSKEVIRLRVTKVKKGLYYPDCMWLCMGIWGLVYRQSGA